MQSPKTLQQGAEMESKHYAAVAIAFIIFFFGGLVFAGYTEEMTKRQVNTEIVRQCAKAADVKRCGEQLKEVLK
jgi:hypothetical protein